MAYAITQYLPFLTDPTKCGGSDTANATIIICGTYPELRTIANGGYAANGNGGKDIRPYSDVGVTTQPYQLKFYTPTTGFILMYVKVANRSHTTAVPINLFCGDASLTTDGSSTAAWDSMWKGAWPLGDGTTLSAVDLTSNANNGTLVNGPTATSGPIHGAGNFVQSSAQAIDIGGSASLIPSSLWISAWVNPSTLAHAVMEILSRDDGASNRSWQFRALSTGTIQFIPFCSVDGVSFATTTTTIPTNTWSRVDAVADGTNSFVYINAVQAATTTSRGTLLGSAGSHAFISGDAGGDAGWDGKLAELRLASCPSNVADQITADYNNGFSPTTFIVAGTFVPLASSGWGQRLAGSRNRRVA